MKNYNGTRYMNFKAKESRIIRNIDKRTKKGVNHYDSTFNNYKTNKDGSRTWSF